ncbi:MAG: protoporphyrinogen oxidase [Deltaproteobacteria bacterium]|nr:protoporphyrinogen oxidase [Deltaproteobacteria bacterium]
MSAGQRIAIIGGGLSGLATAHALQRRDPSLEIDVFEESDVVGGKIQTAKIDGFVCEQGAAGFLDREPATLELCQRLALSPLSADERSEKRFIYNDGRLHQVEMHPLKFLRSKLLPFSAKTRLMIEPFVRRKRGDEDESIAQFARRRIGKHAAEILIDAMQSGIYAGDPERLSVRACFPRVVEVERDYGSLIRGMIKLKRQRADGDTPGAGPSGHLTSFAQGLTHLPTRLAEGLARPVRTRSSVESIRRLAPDQYQIALRGKAPCAADSVILACPADRAAELVAGLDQQMPDLLGQISYAPLCVVCLGYRRDKVRHPLDGFGFLAPKRAKLDILGALFTSSIFPGRAPEGHVLLRVMIGGARAAEIAERDDNEVIEIARRAMSRIVGAEGRPAMQQLFRWPRAIPQYELGHIERVEQLEEHAARHPRLYITGNAFRGIGINDCTKNADLLAARVASELSDPIVRQAAR